MTRSASHSLRRRFFFTLTIVVSSFLVIFTALFISFNTHNNTKNLHNHADLLLNLSQESLSSALWQYNNEYASDYIRSLFNDENIVFAEIIQDNKITYSKTREQYQHIKFKSHTILPGYLIRRGAITYKGIALGEIIIVVTSERVRQSMVLATIVSIFSLILITFGIFSVTYILSKKHLFEPLDRLKKSAQLISEGFLNTPIEIESQDEIGQLANTFKIMIENIKSITATKEELNQEISKRLKFEDALQKSHLTLLSILDGIEATIYVATLDTGEILFMNQYMKELYGKDLTGEKYFDVLKSSRDSSACTNNNFLNLEELPDRVNIFSEFNETLNRWFLYHDRVIKWVDGNFVRLQIATDITKFKMMEDELRQAHKMESVGRLAGGIAHDFNNILAAIQGFSELALETLPPDHKASADILEVLSSSKRAAKLVAQILTFSRKEQTKLTPINIEEITKEAIPLLRATLPTTIKLEEHYSLKNKIIMGDPTMIHQVILNLCTNSSHAMEQEGGVIQIGLNNITVDSKSLNYPDLAPGEYICLTVLDFGSGIKPSDLEHIFEPYFTTKSVGKGSGMGLAVVHGVVQSHNGIIDVDSSPEKGTCFSVYFPSYTQDFLSANKEQESLPSGNERILVIDDEASVVTLTRRRLEALGYQVTGIASSTAALSFFQSHPENFDLIISDQTMPKLRGDQLAQRVREIRPDIPIIITSGFSLKLTHYKATELAINAFIVKPVSRHTLASTVREVLDNARLLTRSPRSISLEDSAPPKQVNNNDEFKAI